MSQQPHVQPHCLALGTPSNSTIGATEWHRWLLESDILQMLDSFLNMCTLDDLGSFTCVLKENTKI